jgi:hypothetical protein
VYTTYGTARQAHRKRAQVREAFSANLAERAETGAAVCVIAEGRADVGGVSHPVAGGCLAGIDDVVGRVSVLNRGAAGAVPAPGQPGRRGPLGDSGYFP